MPRAGVHRRHRGFGSSKSQLLSNTFLLVWTPVFWRQPLRNTYVRLWPRFWYLPKSNEFLGNKCSRSSQSVSPAIKKDQKCVTEWWSATSSCHGFYYCASQLVWGQVPNFLLVQEVVVLRAACMTRLWRRSTRSENCLRTKNNCTNSGSFGKK